jgi:hypothetical protein
MGRHRARLPPENVSRVAVFLPLRRLRRNDRSLGGGASPPLWLWGARDVAVIREECRRSASKAHEETGDAESVRFARREKAEGEAANQRARHPETEIPEEPVAGRDDELARKEARDEPYDDLRAEGQWRPSVSEPVRARVRPQASRSLGFKRAMVGSVAHIRERDIALRT